MTIQPKQLVPKTNSLFPLTHALSSMAPLITGAGGVRETRDHADALHASVAGRTGGVAHASAGDADALHLGVAGEGGRARAPFGVA